MKLAPAPSGPLTVTLDIETAPLKSYHWRIWQENIHLDQIQDDWTILSFSAKWLNDKTVFYMDTGGKGQKKVRDDKLLLTELWRILDKADIVITQNGISFDIKKINTRMLMQGFKPYSPVKMIDTKVVAKRHFAFISNRLQWLTERLTQIKKDKHKKFPGFELWEECLKDNPVAWAEMKKYNIIDTLATEELYLLMRPWIAAHPNVANYAIMEAMMCPRCRSENVIKKGLWFTQTGEYQKILCKDCGGWSRTRYTENSLKKRHNLLSQ
jgi:uncharacterized protein YbaR (Trm112 family)